MGNATTIREKILEAAIAEFGYHGYRSASTNKIHLAAGVSKGAVFKMFKSKAELFYQAFARALDEMLAALDNEKPDNSVDAFDKIMALTFWKMDYAQKYPEATKVMLEAISNPPPSVRERIFQHVEALKRLSIKTFFTDIPMENIRPEFSREDVMKYLEIAISGIQATYLNQPLTLEYMTSIKEESINYIKTVLRGME